MSDDVSGRPTVISIIAFRLGPPEGVPFMSVQAMAWAIEQQEITAAEGRLVLICLANYANASGEDAFPSNARLCRDTGLSESTVRRWLQRLQALSLICLGNQAIAVAKVARADRRPVVYQLVLTPQVSRGVTVTPREVNGVSNPIPRGVKLASTGCQALTPDPSLSVINPKSAHGVSSPARSAGLILEQMRQEQALRFGCDVPQGNGAFFAQCLARSRAPTTRIPS